MTKMGREVFVDREMDVMCGARPGEPELARDSLDGPGPVAEQALVQHEGAREAARMAFDVEDVPEPEQQRLRRAEPVARLERGGHLQRVTERYEEALVGAELAERVEPEGHEAADPWVLHDERRRVAVFVLEQRRQPTAKPVG